MRQLAVLLCLSFSVLLFSAEEAWADGFDGTWRGSYTHAECWDADIEIHVDNTSVSVGLTYLKEAGAPVEMTISFPGTVDSGGNLQATSSQIEGPKGNNWHVNLHGTLLDQAQVTYQEKEFSLCEGTVALEQVSTSEDPLLDFVIEEMAEEKFHALVIGNNNYLHLPKLRTPINDANMIGELLETRYGFEVTTLLDAGRTELLDMVHEFQNKLTITDNLLIYYAGHGELNHKIDKGYWLPVDAKRSSPANWISNADIADALMGFRANHVLLVVDSCYSGTLLRAIGVVPKESTDRLKWIKRVGSKFSRTALTSGSSEPVVDSGGGGHSIFARYLLKALQENNRPYFTGKELFDEVEVPVALNAPQTPQYSDIFGAGGEGGDFIFIRQ